MIAFEVSVNGKKVCVAGADRVVGVSVDWTGRTPDRILFAAGGITTEGGQAHHCAWMVPTIGIGDEVTIRVVETDTPDPAVHQPPDDPAETAP
jgi:hypothetical protein